MRKMVTLMLALAVSAASAGDIERMPAPEEATVYFIGLEDGARVESPVRVRFGLRGMGVAPAGVGQKHTGHHHLLIDTGLPPLDRPVPSDENHRHFGAGQTETTIELAPGTHTLQLLLADHRHIPHEPAVKSDRITIHVAE